MGAYTQSSLISYEIRLFLLRKLSLGLFEPYLWSHSTRPPRPRSWRGQGPSRMALSAFAEGEQSKLQPGASPRVEGGRKRQREENITISWHVYLLRLENGCIYVGSTHNLERRLQEHGSGSGCKTTATSTTIDLIYSECFPDQASALTRERQLKGWSRAKKLALVNHMLADLHQFARSRQRR